MAGFEPSFLDSGTVWLPFHHIFVFKLSAVIRNHRLSLIKETNITQTRVSEIIKGNRRITADTALRLSHFFGNSAKFWLGLQDDLDIETELEEKREELDHIKRFAVA